MKIRLSQILLTVESLKELSMMKLPAIKAFEVADFLEKAEKSANEFLKIRFEKIKQYGKEQKNGEWQVVPAQLATFQSEIEELSSKEIELPDLNLTKDLFKNAEMEPRHLISLKWLIK